MERTRYGISVFPQDVYDVFRVNPGVLGAFMRYLSCLVARTKRMSFAMSSDQQRVLVCLFSPIVSFPRAITSPLLFSCYAIRHTTTGQ
jgi:hypothetical protein